ncbi:glycosyltransferase [Parapedobacter defluvii]|uniref:CgeB family protein n=1 Tax=Parapedobacter defluvii TaxID=2045106 RepID=UPI0033420404
MDILYIGNDSFHSTSYHRAMALKRLGHRVTLINPETLLRSGLVRKLHFRTGYKFLQRQVTNFLKKRINVGNPDLIWVNGGELLGRKSLQVLKALRTPIVLYNNDDPTGTRDGRRFDSLRKALPYYDLCVVRLEKEEDELLKYGVRQVLRVYMSYDEEVHKPFDHPSEIPAQFISDVAFIGTWMRHEKRDEFLLKLIRAGIPVSIWGARWPKSPHWDALKAHYRGGALSGRDYVAAIQGAKICIGMLSHGNRDLHTRRSVETTYAGGLLCAQRTAVHLGMYEENQEAVFWDDVDECIGICRRLLADDKQREHIRKEGYDKVRTLKVGNEDICTAILKRLNF